MSTLAELANDRCLKTSEVAEYLGLSDKTIRQYRADGLGPEYARFGRMIRYRLSEVNKWRDERSNKALRAQQKSQESQQPKPQTWEVKKLY